MILVHIKIESLFSFFLGVAIFFINDTIINGKALAHHLLTETREEVNILMRDHGIKPCLAVILVGNSPASEIYVAHKQKACALVGVESHLYHLPETVTQEQLLRTIHTLNEDSSVHGILVQMPLSPHIQAWDVLQAVNPLKDVDGLHHENLGLLFSSEPRFIPCTPKGCLEILSRITDIKSKRVTVVGRSILVGRPMAALLLKHHATVTIAHRHTVDLTAVTRDADILIVATGKPGLITKNHVKKGAIVLDVGINRIMENGKKKLVGDVVFDEVAPLCHYITPVPGGIGPMTVVSLVQNVLKAASMNSKM